MLHMVALNENTHWIKPTSSLAMITRLYQIIIIIIITITITKNWL